MSISPSSKNTMYSSNDNDSTNSASNSSNNVSSSSMNCNEVIDTPEGLFFKSHGRRLIKLDIDATQTIVNQIYGKADDGNSRGFQGRSLLLGFWNSETGKPKFSVFLKNKVPTAFQYANRKLSSYGWSLVNISNRKYSKKTVFALKAISFV